VSRRNQQTPYPEADVQTLVAQAVAGDEVALVMLLTETRQRLVSDVAIRMSPEFQGVVGPEDIVQETHAEAFRRIGSFEYRGEASFYRWLCMIAIRQLLGIIRQLRAAKRNGKHITRAPAANGQSSAELLAMLSGSYSTPSSHFSTKEAASRLNSAVGRLPEDYAHAIRSVYLNGRAVREIAQELGRTERAVYGMCRRGLKKLQSMLDE